MKKVLIVALAATSSFAFASFSEGFDDITTLAGNGWSQQNLSVPVGSTNWFQGNAAVFVAHAGAATNSYIGANFNNTTGTNTINNWLITPEVTLDNGAVLDFFTRTSTASPFPDRLQVWMSTNGSSTNVADFTNLVLDINPTLVAGGYPNVDWTNFNTALTGLGGPTQGRLAFRYFVTNGGPSGANSNYIGIDTVSYTDAVPEPATMVVLGAAALAAAARKRRK